jgi:hypothetical protein
MSALLYRPPSPRTLTLASLGLVPISLFVPMHEAVPVAGILCWTGLCTACILRNRFLLWAALCGSVLGGIALAYWVSQPLSDNPFSMRLSLIFAFIVAAFVTAGTGVFSIVRTAASSGP